MFHCWLAGRILVLSLTHSIHASVKDAGAIAIAGMFVGCDVGPDTEDCTVMQDVFSVSEVDTVKASKADGQ